MKIVDSLAIRRRILDYASRPVPVEMGQKARGAIIGLLHLELGKVEGMADVEEARRLVCGWLLTPDDQLLRPLHAADILPPAWNGIGRWETERVNGEYTMRPSFPTELVWVLTRARHDEQQNGKTMAELLNYWQEQKLIETAAPDDVPWCEWCGKRPAAPGVPCDQCKLLGAYPEKIGY